MARVLPRESRHTTTCIVTSCTEFVVRRVPVTSPELLGMYSRARSKQYGTVTTSPSPLGSVPDVTGVLIQARRAEPGVLSE